MLENSYDLSGIKFAIIMSCNFPKYSKVLAGADMDASFGVIQKAVEYSNADFVDFENFDGLTIGEILKMGKDMQAKSTIVFASYSGFKTNHQLPNMLSLDNLSIEYIQCTDENKDRPIDEVIAEKYFSQYDETKFPKKCRKIKCFLQRYKYGTKERTDEVLKEKVYKK